MQVMFFEGLGDLPHFNPDLEGSGDDPPPVQDFCARLRAADGVLISSPEYAHGIPGVLKNALDWVVGSGELVGKPVALLGASPHSTHAQASLTEVLTTMAAVLIPEASVTLPLRGKGLDAAGIAADAEFSKTLRSALAAFALAVDAHRTSPS